MSVTPSSNRILVAPLNWGLGHATRCIPIVRELLACGFQPILATDGAALDLLRKEFPDLKLLELPSYGIRYSKNQAGFRWKLLASVPQMWQAIRAENRLVNAWIDQYDIDGIISDNRPGVRSTRVPSVYITHQIRVLSGWSTKLSTWVHQKIIEKFDCCWIPDFETEPNLSGVLGHGFELKIPKEYIGPISRLNPNYQSVKYDVFALISGPEPQRTLLENKILAEFSNFPGSVLVARGVTEEAPNKEVVGNLEVWNYLTSDQIENAMNQSRYLVSRSGYTTLMDAARFGKKCFFIPTPGQYEQEYLAQKLKEEKQAPFASQKDFNLELFYEIENYKGLNPTKHQPDWKRLFGLFKRKEKF